MSTTVLERPLTEAPPGDKAPGRLRISAAIRAGAQYHGPGRGHFYCHQSRTTCALGALAVGLLGPQVFETSFWAACFDPVVYERTGVRLEQYVPGLEREPALRPLVERTGIDRCSLMQAIAYLNDGAQWSREAIADWLAERGF